MAGKLIDIFQNCKCVKEEKHLAAGEVRSLAFGDNNTVMVVELGLHEVVSRKVIARAEKQIADTYGLDRVMIEPRYNMPGELSNAYIKSLYDDMAYRMPSAKGLLDHTKWEFADGALQIPMDEVSEKHFANALRHLEARIRRELDMVCPVHAVRAAAEDYAPPSDAPKREEILLNAGIALYLGLDGLTLADGIKKAAEMIDSGASLAKLDRFAAATQEAAKA